MRVSIALMVALVACTLVGVAAEPKLPPILSKGQSAGAAITTCPATTGITQHPVTLLMECRPCLPGYFKNDALPVPCSACPAGSWSGEGETACTWCPSGMSSPSGSPGCDECSFGTFAVSGDVDGSNGAKATGAYDTNYRRYPFLASDHRGAGVCSPCPLNTYQSAARAASCPACPPGFQTSAPGAAFCTPNSAHVETTVGVRQHASPSSPAPSSFLEGAPAAAKKEKTPPKKNIGAATPVTKKGRSLKEARDTRKANKAIQANKIAAAARFSSKPVKQQAL